MKAYASIVLTAFVVALFGTNAFSQVPVRCKIHWSPPTGADVAHVLVYRSATDKDNNFVPIGTLAPADTIYADSDASLASDVTYWYRLRSQNASGVVGSFSTYVVSALSISPSASAALKSQCRVDSVVTIDSAQCRVYWTTAVPSRGKLRYWRVGTSTVVESATASTLSTQHNLVVGGLVKTAIYYVRAVSYDATGRALVISAEQSFSSSPPAPDFTIVPNVSSVTVPENGTAGFGVKLSARPSGAVQIALTRASGDSDISIQSGGALSFTTTNWNTYQTVTLAACHDADDVNGSSSIMAYVSSGGSAPTTTVTAVESDDDGMSSVLNFVLDHDTLDVPEGGTSQFHVRLTGEPAADVQAVVYRSAGDANVTVQSSATLAFTASSWNVDQAVTLAAAADQDVVGGVATFLIRATAGSSVLDAQLTARENDDDSLFFVVEFDTLVVPEAGTAQFHVRLAFEPPADVHATVARSSGDADIVVQSSGALVFTPANWSSDRTITLAAAADPDVEDGAATILVHADSGPAVPDAALIATEDDGGVLYFVFDRDTIVVPEGSTAQFHLKLTAEPSSTVTMTVSRWLGDGDVTVQSGTSLVFTTADWNVDQTVTLAAAEDADTDDGQAAILVHVTSGAVIPDAALPVREDDNDSGDNGHHQSGASGPVVSYPMPFQPGQGALHITNLPRDGSVNLFDVSGRKIWSYTWSGRDEISWNGANNQACSVASGRYFMVVKDGAGRVVDKQPILVVR